MALVSLEVDLGDDLIEYFVKPLVSIAIRLVGGLWTRIHTFTKVGVEACP